jgi:hypothetical protein
MYTPWPDEIYIRAKREKENNRMAETYVTVPDEVDSLFSIP